MEFVENVADEIIEHFNLKTSTKNIWKARNQIPDTYFSMEAESIFNPDLTGFVSIPDFPAYLICRDGKVYSKLSRKIVKVGKNNGKKVVYLKSDEVSKQQTTQLHRLLALTFLEIPKNPDSAFVGFKDGNSDNLAVENLYWYEKEKVVKQKKEKRKYVRKTMQADELIEGIMNDPTDQIASVIKQERTFTNPKKPYTSLVPRVHHIAQNTAMLDTEEKLDDMIKRVREKLEKLEQEKLELLAKTPYTLQVMINKAIMRKLTEKAKNEGIELNQLVFNLLSNK